MWLHESESNSIIREAYENKIFLTIIYISNNSPCHHLVSRTFSGVRDLESGLKYPDSFLAWSEVLPLSPATMLPVLRPATLCRTVTCLCGQEDGVRKLQTSPRTFV